MPSVLQGKYVSFGVTGSIACYKAVDLASKLVQEGALVDVIMTREALQFVTPLSFRALTHRYVVSDLFDPQSELSMDHVALAQRADIVVVAPATANVLAKVAAGMADDALTATILATMASVLIAPAMDANMFSNPATQENVAKLKARGITIVGPAQGRLASGLIGLGRMVEVPELLGHIKLVLGRKGDLAGLQIVVSAGGTREFLDPVRILTNPSSGKMGYAIAEAARDRGASVTLVSATTGLPDPVGVKVLKVNTTIEMRDAIVRGVSSSIDALIMAAAVSDYRPAETLPQKLKKTAKELTVKLVRNPDILEEVRGTFMRVGFAAESENAVENARLKLVQKGLDLIVANDVTLPGSGFASDTNKVVIIERNGKVEELPLMSKYDVAQRILDRVFELLKNRRG